MHVINCRSGIVKGKVPAVGASMTKILLPLLLLPILILLLTGHALPQEVSIGYNRNFPAVSHESKLYIGTHTGLLTYDPSSDIWTARYTGETPLSNRINALAMDEDILWVATMDGIASSDVRLGDWIRYTKSDGLPSDTILSIGFEEDYAWLGTPKGAARFDKLTEEWVSFDATSGLSSERVNDIVVRADRVWFATDYGVSEYDSEYEAWRTYTEETSVLSGCIERAYASRGFLWFFGEKGISRYDENTRSWSEYAWKELGAPDKIESEGDSLWLVIGGSIVLYDSHLDLFSDFEYESDLGDREVRYASVGEYYIWVATDRDIARFERGRKTWRFYGPAQGLLSDDFLTVAEFGWSIFAAARDGTISYQEKPEGRWYQREPPSPVEAKAAARLNLVADERGTGLILPPDNSLLLKGNTTWTFVRGKKDWSEPEKISDLTVSGLIHGGRTLSGRYDDRYMERTEYGLTFRGAPGDLLQGVSLGDGRSEFGRDRLIQSLDMFGVSADVGYGEKTGRAKTVGLSFKDGERRSGFHTDFFTGRRNQDSLSIRDIDYWGNAYFTVDTLGLWLPVVHGSEKVYIDDGDSESNTANTILDTTIAGVTGDFDRHYPLFSYWMDYRSGIIRCVFPCDTSSVLAVVYRSPAGEREVIVRSDSVSGFELLNRYRIGKHIIPMSLSVSIVDTLGVAHDLSEFGLDRNLDGLVDSEYLDFDRGVLIFPDRRPFPDEVYETGTNIFTMLVNYKTTSPTYRLSHRRLVRLSETVKLDGITLERGNDYVLDYTTGRMIMLREELIGDKSQVDVSYEYERDSDEQLSVVELKVNPNNTLRANLRGIRFSDVDRNLESSDVIQGSMEVRTKFRGLHLRIPVELAKSMGDALEGMAQRYSLYASSKRLRASCAFGSYDSDFVSFYTEEGRLGNVRKTYELGGQYYLLDWLVGGAEWEHQTFVPGRGGSEPYVDNGRAELFLSKPRLPALSITAGTHKSVSDTMDERTRQIGSALSYTVSKEEVTNLPVKSLNLSSSFVRTWWQEVCGDSSGMYDGASFAFLSTIFPGVSLGTEYFHKAGIRDSVEGTGSYQSSRTGEVRFSSSIDRISGLSLYAKTEREVDESPHSDGSDRRDGELEWRDYARIGSYPGMWFRALSFIDFEYEISKNLSAHIRRAPGPLSLGQRYWNISYSLFDSETDSRTDNFKSHIRPHVSLLLDLIYERRSGEDRVLDSSNKMKTDRYNARVEYTPTYRSILTFYYDLTSRKSSPIATGKTVSPSVWWEEKWTSWMFTKAGFSYWRHDDSVGDVGSARSTFAPRVSATLRARSLPLLGDLELTWDGSANRSYDSHSSPPAYTSYGSYFQLDIKPRRLLRVRTNLNLSYNRYWDGALFITLSGTF